MINLHESMGARLGSNSRPLEEISDSLPIALYIMVAKENLSQLDVFLCIATQNVQANGKENIHNFYS